MPGVIMENGDHRESPTNHDRGGATNRVNGLVNGIDGTFDGYKDKVSSRTPGHNSVVSAESSLLREVTEQAGQLAPEILHITDGFISLPKLLSRRAQVSHNNMNQMIQALANMALPPAAVNGNGNYTPSSGDEASIEQLKKKVALLKFAEKEHADWVKALVITSWSRISEDIRKLIDLKVHLDAKKLDYEWAVDGLVELKRGMVNARLPNPDLRTALEVLSTGQASWMPDLGYVETPPLTGKELMKSMQELNSVLAIRLNLQDFDKIPYHFRNFSIKSGRVTFRVEGEFEVDLTIADEDPVSQFWFIDFRFLFSPAPGELHETLRSVVDDRVNSALEKEGLEGAYRYLHELTLTHKLSEFRRQATELGKGRWIDSVKTESLHRALSIQYWSDRFPQKTAKDSRTPKNWVILGLHSGRSKSGKLDCKATSYIKLRWFREGKEINDDFQVPLDLVNISAENLIQELIRQHTFIILDRTYEAIRSKPLYANEQLQVSASFIGSKSDLQDMHLNIQLTREDNVRLEIEPVTGRFIISGGSKLSLNTQWSLNSQLKDASALSMELEQLRCETVTEMIINRAMAVGWISSRGPGITSQDLKPIVPKDTIRISWLRRAGWSNDWVLAFTVSGSGERFWLFQTLGTPPASVKIVNKIRVPLRTTTPSISHKFFTDLHLLTSALISYQINLRTFHDSHIPYRLLKNNAQAVASTVVLPVLVAKLSKISKFTTRPWAKDLIKISFLGIDQAIDSSPLQLPAQTLPFEDVSASKEQAVQPEIANLVAQAMMSSPMPAGLDVVKHQVDKDIAFHPTSGAFAVKLCHRVGDSALPQLREKLFRVEQLVNFVRAAKKHSKTLHLENISLGKVDLSYDECPIIARGQDITNAPQASKHRATIDFSRKGKDMSITFESGNPHIRLLDFLTKILNRLGLDGVATYLPLTLPVLRAFDDIEDRWVDVENGDVLLLSRAVDNHLLRYTIAYQSLEPSERRIDFEIKLDHRGSEPWWRVGRTPRSSAEGDYFEAALDKIWESSLEGEQGWRGMQFSAIAQPTAIAALLQRVDETMHNLAANPPPAEEEIATVPEQAGPTQLKPTLSTSQQAPILPPKYASVQQTRRTEMPPNVAIFQAQQPNNGRLGQQNLQTHVQQQQQQQQRPQLTPQQQRAFQAQLAQMSPQMKQEFLRQQQARLQAQSQKAKQHQQQQQGKGGSDAIVID